jgi:hypothetical protein
MPILMVRADSYYDTVLCGLPTYWKFQSFVSEMYCKIQELDSFV